MASTRVGAPARLGAILSCGAHVLLSSPAATAQRLALKRNWTQQLWCAATEELAEWGHPLDWLTLHPALHPAESLQATMEKAPRHAIYRCACLHACFMLASAPGLLACLRLRACRTACQLLASLFPRTQRLLLHTLVCHVAIARHLSHRYYFLCAGPWSSGRRRSSGWC